MRGGVQLLLRWRSVPEFLRKPIVATCEHPPPSVSAHGYKYQLGGSCVYNGQGGLGIFFNPVGGSYVA